MRWILALVFAPLTAFADDRAALYGAWGDAPRCAGAPALQGGSVPLAPVEIAPGWLAQGPVWCRLIWFPVQPRDDGLFVSARAMCGEDSAVAYRVDFALGAEGLRVIWDEALVNGPWERCQ